MMIGNGTATPIVGRACGYSQTWGDPACPCPALYLCPLCRASRCLDHSPIAKPPSKRKCCASRTITEGEVQAWKSGDAAHATALILKQETQRLLRHIGLILRDARTIAEGEVGEALKATKAWAAAGIRYLDAASMNTDDVRYRVSAGTCSDNAARCAGWARDWSVAATMDIDKGIVRSKGGLHLLASPEAAHDDTADQNR